MEEVTEECNNKQQIPVRFYDDAVWIMTEEPHELIRENVVHLWLGGSRKVERRMVFNTDGTELRVEEKSQKGKTRDIETPQHKNNLI